MRISSGIKASAFLLILILSFTATASAQSTGPQLSQVNPDDVELERPSNIIESIIQEAGMVFDRITSLQFGVLGTANKEMCETKPDSSGCDPRKPVPWTFGTNDDKYHWTKVDFDDQPQCVNMRFDWVTRNSDGATVDTQTYDPAEYCASDGYYVAGWWAHYEPRSGANTPDSYTTTLTVREQNRGAEFDMFYDFTVEGDSAASITARLDDIVFGVLPPGVDGLR